MINDFVRSLCQWFVTAMLTCSGSRDHVLQTRESQFDITVTLIQCRRTKRWEAHIWDDKKQVYLGGFDIEEHAGLLPFCAFTCVLICRNLPEALFSCAKADQLEQGGLCKDER